MRIEQNRSGEAKKQSMLKTMKMMKCTTGWLVAFFNLPDKFIFRFILYSFVFELGIGSRSNRLFRLLHRAPSPLRSHLSHLSPDSMLFPFDRSVGNQSKFNRPIGRARTGPTTLLITVLPDPFGLFDDSSSASRSPARTWSSSSFFASSSLSSS